MSVGVRSPRDRPASGGGVLECDLAGLLADISQRREVENNKIDWVSTVKPSAPEIPLDGFIKGADSRWEVEDGCLPDLKAQLEWEFAEEMETGSVG